MESVGIVVFTRDLRISDNPVLHNALKHNDRVVPMFIFDPKIVESLHASANRVSYLCECLHDLRKSLKEIGSDLIIRHGNWTDQVMKAVAEFSATHVGWAREVSSYGQKRDRELKALLDQSRVFAACLDSHTVVPPDALSPSSATTPREFKVFTPYYNRWAAIPSSPVLSAPATVRLPKNLDNEITRGEIPDLTKLVKGELSPNREIGGETLARNRLNAWVKEDLENYEINHDLVAIDKTSHTSSALHFGTLSANELVAKLRNKKGAGAFIRQLCWRDFYHQILFYNPKAS